MKFFLFSASWVVERAVLSFPSDPVATAPVPASIAVVHAALPPVFRVQAAKASAPIPPATAAVVPAAVANVGPVTDEGPNADADAEADPNASAGSGPSEVGGRSGGAESV